MRSTQEYKNGRENEGFYLNASIINLLWKICRSIIWSAGNLVETISIETGAALDLMLEPVYLRSDLKIIN